ncbi:MAG TPA: heme ABC transporter permease [Alphaproteobacteria bacterium]|nr:heme ABC transporter permease [Alphaproteobacteria bacterium]
MHRFANPARFAQLAAAATPWGVALTALLFVAGLALALFASPPDYQQGETVRIMYVHVPAAWMAMFVYVVVAAGSASALVWRHPLGDVIARAASPIGACFTLMALLTGSLWGKPIWGTWWVWDARLTSVLVLFFLYLGHIALLHAFDEPSRGARAAAILALAGIVNLPIIKFSVDWWNTLHQPASISRLERPAIDPSILAPLLVMAGAYFAYFVTLLMVRVRTELASAKLRAFRAALAAQG